MRMRTRTRTRTRTRMRMRMRMRMRDFAAPDELKRFARNKCRMAVLSSHAMAELAGLDTARLQRQGPFVCLSHM